MKIAFVFPGQGSQHVGMASDLYNNFKEVRELYRQAEEVLGYDLAGLSFRGPAEELNKTIKTQPCLLLASISAYTVITSKNVLPSVVAGHSLGEYSALVASEVFSLGDGLEITEMRGKMMQEAVPEGEGMMAAILGLQRQDVDKICLDVKVGYVRSANYNCPGQIVISGQRQAVTEAMRLMKEAGAKRAIPLRVSVPSHSALMENASKRLSEFLFLEDIYMNEPKIPIVSNADAIFLTTAIGVKASLVKQLQSPVLWEDSVREMVKFGVDTFVEVGPGTVLSGLIKRIEPSAKLLNVQDTESLEQTLAALK
ncbi:MAG: ACP S-malonyltransferase [Nitrospirae bacterium]|nr:ACP S-malonyltransferase [Nitrospirota bacterium]